MHSELESPTKVGLLVSLIYRVISKTTLHLNLYLPFTSPLTLVVAKFGLRSIADCDLQASCHLHAQVRIPLLSKMDVAG
jgi:hypothetical protein